MVMRDTEEILCFFIIKLSPQCPVKDANLKNVSPSLRANTMN